VVASIQEACDEAGIEHPDIVSESGRALSAYHSVLVFDTLEVNEILRGGVPEPATAQDHKILRELVEAWENTRRDSVQETYHDVLHLREEAATLFSLGYIDLEVRGRVENLVLDCFEKILGFVRQLETVPEDLAGLERELADTYYGNFSVFQSAPDHWAVGQLFPVMPIHRLDEEPRRRGVLADLTCDSDGKIDKFIDPLDVSDVLPLHHWTGAPYYIGVFLVGAYQEILGDLHNLFGDTNAVHVRLDRDGIPRIEHTVEGDRVDDVLRYVQFETKSLVERVRNTAERALAAGQMSANDVDLLCELYEQGLREYTYLSRDD
jgi:arginine decarboxylase